MPVNPSITCNVTRACLTIFLGALGIFTQCAPASGVAPVEAVKNSIGMEFVLVPAGDFMMGSPDWETKEGDKQLKAHQVRITRPFLLGRYEVTQSEWREVMESNPSHFSSTGEKRAEVSNLDTDRFPVENITWYDAVKFCNRLSQSEGLPEYYTLENERKRDYTFLGKTTVKTDYDVSIAGGSGYRLPTEAEWEYACRAGTTTRYFHGDAENGQNANINGKYPYGTDRKGRELGRPTLVGEYKPNAFGLYDMHGNVSEFCYDEREEDIYEWRGRLTLDPVFARRTIVGDPNTTHIIRGGSWQSGAKVGTSYYRFWTTPTSTSGDEGFRVARFPN